MHVIFTHESKSWLACAQRVIPSQIANIIGPTLHIDWVIGVWLRSHVHDWANVGVVVHSHAIFADIGPILANDLLLQRIMKVVFFHRNKSGRIFVSHCNKRSDLLKPVTNIISVTVSKILQENP